MLNVIVTLAGTFSMKENAVPDEGLSPICVLMLGGVSPSRQLAVVSRARLITGAEDVWASGSTDSGPTNTHASPVKRKGVTPPIRAVAPLLASATLAPNAPLALSSPPISCEPASLQAEPERVKTHAEPASLFSWGSPTSATFPLPESATLEPKLLPAVAPPVSLGPCWDQLDPERVYTQAEPALAASSGPPIRAVSPLSDSATL